MPSFLSPLIGKIIQEVIERIQGDNVLVSMKFREHVKIAFLLEIQALHECSMINKNPDIDNGIQLKG